MTNLGEVNITEALQPTNHKKVDLVQVVKNAKTYPVNNRINYFKLSLNMNKRDSHHYFTHGECETSMGQALSSPTQESSCIQRGTTEAMQYWCTASIKQRRN